VNQTTSLLAQRAAFAAMHGISPAVPGMPSVGSGKTKVQEGVHRRMAEGKRLCSCSTRSVRAVRMSSLSNSQIDLVPRERMSRHT